MHVFEHCHTCERVVVQETSNTGTGYYDYASEEEDTVLDNEGGNDDGNEPGNDTESRAYDSVTIGGTYPLGISWLTPQNG